MLPAFVLRILTESPDSQLTLALSFYEEQRQAGIPLFISDPVLSECYFPAPWCSPQLELTAT
jgi:hypothetical protein